MNNITKQELFHQLQENLKDAFSLVILLENDLSVQREDEVYIRTIHLIHQKLKATIEVLERKQE